MSDYQFAPELISNPDSVVDMVPPKSDSVPIEEQETLKQMDLVICGDLDEKLQRLDAMANECSEAGQSEEVV
jgi:hypothetical protein